MSGCIKSAWLLSGLLAVFLLTGCIIVGTFVIDFEVDETDIDALSEGIYHFNVDLTTDEDWEDHKDKIKDIDNVGFVLKVTNGNSSDITIKLYIDDVDLTPYTNSGDIETNTTQVLSDITLSGPSGTSTIIDWPTSLTKVMNIATLKSQAESGEFGIYVISEGQLDFTIDFAVVAVTVTAGE